MRLPYLQVSHEDSRRLGAELQALDKAKRPGRWWRGLLEDLWAWGLSLDGDRRPTGVLDHPSAPDRLAGVLEWTEPVSELIDLLEMVGVVEVTRNGGLRVCGVVDRYGRAWDRQQQQLEASAKGAEARRRGAHGGAQNGAPDEPLMSPSDTNAPAPRRAHRRINIARPLENQPTGSTGSHPIGTPKTETETETERRTTTTEAFVEQARPVREVFAHWQAVMGKPKAVLDKKRERAVAARLAEGRTVDDLKLAVDGCSKTPHNMGINDRGEKFNDLELICRNGPNVERFMANATAPPRLAASKGALVATPWTEADSEHFLDDLAGVPR